MNKEKYVEELRVLLAENGEKEKDIVAAIKYAENLLDLNLPVIFDKYHFAALLGIEVVELTAILTYLEEKYYHSAEIEKKNGGIRELLIPSMKLRLIQKWILKNILYTIHISDHAMGFRKEHSIVTNATPHLGKRCVVNMDLKDFFPSISQKQVFRMSLRKGLSLITLMRFYITDKICA